MQDFIPAIIILLVGAPLSFVFYRWYVQRHRWMNRETEAMIAEALEHNRHVDKHGGTYKSIVIAGRRY